MESQLNQLAEEVVGVDAPERGSDVENPSEADSVGAIQAEREIQIIEAEIAEITAAAQAREVPSTTEDMDADFQIRLAAVETQEQRHEMVAKYEAERRKLRTRFDAEQTERRTRLQAKLEAKKQAAAAAATAARSRRSADESAEQVPLTSSSTAHQPGVVSVHDESNFEDIAKSIVADYTNQMVRTQDLSSHLSLALSCVASACVRNKEDLSTCHDDTAPILQAAVTNSLGQKKGAGKARLEARLAKRKLMMERKLSELAVLTHRLESRLEREGMSAQSAVTVAAGLTRLKRKAKQNLQN